MAVAAKTCIGIDCHTQRVGRLARRTAADCEKADSIMR